MTEDRSAQRDRVLQAFLQAGGRCLTTMELRRIPGAANPTARVSDLRKLGHRFRVERIVGTDSFVHHYEGMEPSQPELPGPKGRRLEFVGHLPIEAGFQVWEVV